MSQRLWPFQERDPLRYCPSEKERSAGFEPNSRIVENNYLQEDWDPVHWTPQLPFLSFLVKPSSAGNELDSWPGRDDGSAFRTLGVVRLDVR